MTHNQISLVVEDNQETADAAARIIGSIWGSNTYVQTAYTLSDAVWYMQQIKTLLFVFLDGIMPYVVNGEKKLENTLDFFDEAIDRYPQIIWIAFSALNNHALIELAQKKGAKILACNQKDVGTTAKHLFKSYRDIFFHQTPA